MSETKEYAFTAGVIRLNGKDLDKWRRAYPNVSVEAEMLALAPWAAKQKNWYTAVSAALAKREREARRPVYSSRRRIERDPLGNPIEVGDDE
jgi:hypothetical protein